MISLFLIFFNIPFFFLKICKIGPSKEKIGRAEPFWMGVGHGKVIEKSELGPTPLNLILILFFFIEILIY
jgi:hypothetical protein